VLSSSEVILGDNLDVLPRFGDETFQLIYIDPPFNTGKAQTRKTLQTVPDESGDRTGFTGRRYKTRLLAESSYLDEFDDYLAFLEPRLREAHRLLAESGTFYFHIDYREAHYCKLLLDEIFGREGFLNELIWAYDYGARSKRRWPPKHDTILVYVKDPMGYYYDAEAVDREPYMAPGLVTPEKLAKGKLPTDVWWHTIVPTNGREKTGYPTQKPEGIIRRMIQASTRSGDWCLDFFAGSGTLGAVAAKLDRRYVLIDCNPEAIRVAGQRLGMPLQDDQLSGHSGRGPRVRFPAGAFFPSCASQTGSSEPAVAPPAGAVSRATGAVSGSIAAGRATLMSGHGRPGRPV
jgi:site-specific DNA-methyltransferase (adenine-specific)